MADAIKVKVVILGDTCVGKSCFLMRFVNNAVTQNHISTIGVDVRNKTLVTKKGKVNLQIWDTAGQEKFRSLSPSYLRNTDSVILLYDITNQETLTQANTAIREGLERNNEVARQAYDERAIAVAQADQEWLDQTGRTREELYKINPYFH